MFIKDIPNNLFRHILLSNNENKPVTNSRDTQEVMLDPGREILRIFHQFKSKTSILDDFGFYDKRQELMEQRTQMGGQVPPQMTQMQMPGIPLGQMPPQMVGMDPAQMQQMQQMSQQQMPLGGPPPGSSMPPNARPS